MASPRRIARPVPGLRTRARRASCAPWNAADCVESACGVPQHVALRARPRDTRRSRPESNRGCLPEDRRGLSRRSAVDLADHRMAQLQSAPTRPRGLRERAPARRERWTSVREPPKAHWQLGPLTDQRPAAIASRPVAARAFAAFASVLVPTARPEAGRAPLA